jgi:hypothetical protein
LQIDLKSEEVLTSPRPEPKGAYFWNSPTPIALMSVKIGTIFCPVIPCNMEYPLVGTPSTLHYHMKLFINNALDVKKKKNEIFFKKFMSISNMKHNCGVHHQIPTTPTPPGPPT